MSKSLDGALFKVLSAVKLMYRRPADMREGILSCCCTRVRRNDVSVFRSARERFVAMVRRSGLEGSRALRRTPACVEDQ